MVNIIGSLNLRLVDLREHSVGQLVRCIFHARQGGPALTSLGWISIFARLSVCASTAYVAAQMIQGLLILNLESYEPLGWHRTMLYWLVLLIAVLVNILGIKVFPHIETAAFVFHICFFFALLVPLVYLSPRSTASFVFADFESTSGWKSDSVSWCLGLLTTAWCFVSEYLQLDPLFSLILKYPGIDGTSHMSQQASFKRYCPLYELSADSSLTGEEVRDSAVVVPRSMMLALFISGAFTLAFSIAILFGIGDITLALTSPTKYPIIYIFHFATGSKGATTAMVCALITALLFSTFGLLACASRLAWAFARDQGFPYSNYFAHVSTPLT